MNLLKTIVGLTKVYFDANKQSMVSVHINDEHYNFSVVYKGLDIIEDEYFVYLGEIGSDSFDISIVKNKITTMCADNGNVIIELINGKKFIITIDTECEVEDGMYTFNPTD